MIDRSLFNAEDFLVDHTFQQYCAGQDKRCIAFWEAYVKTHPEQKEVIDEAKRLYVILSGNKKPLDSQLDNLKHSIENKTSPEAEVALVNIRRRYTWLKIAAAILVVASITFLYTHINTDEPTRSNQEYVTHFSSKEGERKKITLSDGSTVLLNFRSSLKLRTGFNQNTREVELVGEAFFDVAKDKDKPFMVHTSDFNINVLGTSFNVKVYPEDATSEAVLIEGLIVMEPKDNEGSSITMKPSQKVTFYKTKPPLPSTNEKVNSKATHKQEIYINQYTQNEDNSIAEMAWTQNRLEIMDEDFGELKNVLERWYNVQINFKDKEVEGYRFTATFANKSIQEVLTALQKAKYFKYEINENQITISK